MVEMMCVSLDPCEGLWGSMYHMPATSMIHSFCTCNNQLSFCSLDCHSPVRGVVYCEQSRFAAIVLHLTVA